MYPIKLPSDHPVVKLLIIIIHDLLHTGTSILMCHLREKYGILNSRKTIKNCVRKFIKCERFKAKKYKTIPSVLPKHRIHYSCVFEVVGCDDSGPLYLKGDRKSYVMLHNHTVHLVVHLELVTSLMT